MAKKNFTLVLLILLFCLGNLSLFSSQVDAHYLRLLNKGVAAFQAENYREALKDFKLAVFGLTDPKVKAQIYAHISLCDYILNDMEECEEYFHRVEQYIRANGLDSLELQGITRRSFAQLWNRFNPHEAIFIESNGDQPASGSDSEAALRKRIVRLNRQIDSVPEDIIAFYDLYEAYLLIQDDKKAKKTLEKMIDSNPREYTGFYLIGLLEYKERDYGSVVKNLEKYLSHMNGQSVTENPRIAPAWAYLILSHNYRGDKKKAYQLTQTVADTITLDIVKEIGLEQKDEAVLKEILARVKKSE